MDSTYPGVNDRLVGAYKPLVRLFKAVGVPLLFGVLKPENLPRETFNLGVNIFLKSFLAPAN